MPFGRSRRVRTGSQTALAMLAFATVLVFAGLFVARFPERIDLTDVGAQSLSEETRKVLASLETDVHAIAFPSREGGGPEALRDLLENCRVASRRFTYEMVDAERNLSLAKQYEVRSLDTTVLVAGGKSHNVTEATEQALTNGLRELLLDRERKVYFTAGHGEHPLEGTTNEAYSGVRGDIQGANFPVEPLTLITAEKIPDDAAAIIIGGPRKPFMEPEIELLRAYVLGGGALIVLLDPENDAGLRELLKEWGVGLDDDLIVDKFSRMFGGDYTTPVVMEYNADSFMAGFNVATFFPEARSIEPLSPAPPGITVTRLASTSQAAWGERGTSEIKEGVVEFQAETDIPGPVPVAVLSELPPRDVPAQVPAEGSSQENEGDGNGEAEGAARGRVIVFGDSDFIADAYLGLSGNADFFLNTLEYLAREANPVLIERRQREGAPLFMTAGQGQALTLVSFALSPGLVLLGGLMVWRSRRKNR
ncbi:MAG: Gldg family protein [Deltaproteobacteria bacterium]|nr:Gldg family protein [Deltaproteobacteria bacterium]